MTLFFCAAVLVVEVHFYTADLKPLCNRKQVNTQQIFNYVFSVSDEGTPESRHSAVRSNSDLSVMNKEDKHIAKFQEILQSDCPDLGWYFYFYL